MIIELISDLRKAFRNGPYAWPGGYPCFFVLADGELLSFAAAKANRRRLIEALADYRTNRHELSGWRPVALEINWEDSELICVDSGTVIEFGIWGIAMNNLNEIMARARKEANRIGGPVAVYNLNPFGRLYVIREWKNGAAADHGLVARVVPEI